MAHIQITGTKVTKRLPFLLRVRLIGEARALWCAG
jgi:hypothetical protein